jgi:uncharacterized membrane protein YtjA (UPF0391 family)
MLRMTLAFLFVALVAGLFGFGLIGGPAPDAAKVLFLVFLVLAVVSFLADSVRGRTAIPT